MSGKITHDKLNQLQNLIGEEIRELSSEAEANSGANPSKVGQEQGGKAQGTIQRSFSRYMPSTEVESLPSQKVKDRSVALEKLERLKALRTRLESHGKRCTLYFQVSLLNRGGTDGLIKALGVLQFRDGEKVPIRLTSKPSFLNEQTAVPVLLLDSEYFGSLNAVGKVTQTAVSQMWYIGEDKVEGDRCDSDTVVLNIPSYGDENVRTTASY